MYIHDKALCVTTCNACQHRQFTLTVELTGIDCISCQLCMIVELAAITLDK